MIVDSWKESHIAMESERFDDAVDGIRYLLNYKSKYEDESLVRDLTEKILCLRGLSKYEMFASLSNNLLGYNIGFSPIQQMEEVRHFISHEILDDGDPGIGYYKKEKELSVTVVPCFKGDNGAKPYFCRSLEKLRKFDPSAEYCSIENALKVVQFYIDQDTRIIERNQEFNKRFKLGDNSILEGLEEEQLQYIQLCKELKEE